MHFIIRCIICYAVYYPYNVVILCASEICEREIQLGAHIHCLTEKDKILHLEKSAFIININLCFQNSFS